MALSPPNANNAGLWARHAAPRAKMAFDRHPADRDRLYPQDTPNDVSRTCQRGRRHIPIMNAQYPFISSAGAALPFYYDFCPNSCKLRVTPAMEAGIKDVIRFR
jgi:hypothetical protein